MFSPSCKRQEPKYPHRRTKGTLLSPAQYIVFPTNALIPLQAEALDLRAKLEKYATDEEEMDS